jgi:1-phosphatidylinositol-4-phosphate 5-kinase
VIDGKHELYTLSIAMMLGLRYSIFLTNNQILEDRKNGRMWLDSDEFMKVEKYIFRPDGGQNTPPHQLSHTFKFKDYSPIPFAFIRRMFGINEYEFHHSVCGNANFIEFISNAKSGQFFFYSSDGKFMIKTMTNVESKFLRRSKSWISSNLI